MNLHVNIEKYKIPHYLWLEFNEIDSPYFNHLNNQNDQRILQFKNKLL